MYLKVEKAKILKKCIPCKTCVRCQNGVVIAYSMQLYGNKQQYVGLKKWSHCQDSCRECPAVIVPHVRIVVASAQL